MNLETDARRAHIEAIMNRLRDKYTDRAPQPRRDEEQAGEPLSIQMLQRLYRHVLAEGYGE